VRAAGGDGSTAQAALSRLCEAYWYPIYAYIRRSSYTADEAEDLTQGFFAHVLERHTIDEADPARGKLRSFLIGCVNHYLSDQRDRAMARKRGAGLVTSFDGTWAEERYGTEPADDLTPDRLFQRRWAITVLEHALQLTSEEFSAQGKADLFEALRPFLGFGPEPEEGYEEISARLHIPTGTLKSHVSRLRQRWRDIVFEQVAMTLGDPSPERIKAELTELLACV
jgi:RNA polymerase sigma-70 factor (ECF subfamily)